MDGWMDGAEGGVRWLDARKFRINLLCCVVH